MRQPPLLDIVKHAGNLKCLFGARIHSIKNLLFLLKVLKEIRSTVSLTIVGPVEDNEYWEACQTFAKGMPANVTISYEGPVPNHKLVSIIQQHHLFFLPTVGENFGHSIFDVSFETP